VLSAKLTGRSIGPAEHDRTAHLSAAHCQHLGRCVQYLVERKDSRGRWQRVTTVRAKVVRGRFSVSPRLKTAGLYRLTPWTGKTKAPVLYVRAVRAAATTGGTAA